MGIHMALASLGTLVILPRYRPDWTLEALNKHQITVMLGSPTIYAGLLGYEGLAEADFSHLEVSISGSAALPEEILVRWERQTGSRILEGYGQTESGPVLSFNPRHGRGKEGSVGLVVPETDVQIVDLATGEVLNAPGSVGEIRARGPQMMQGYRNLPTETAEALRDGWLYTGDIGEFDAEGYLFIRGRRKEMVIVGGFNVYPREVEEVLFSHPDVADAVVVGVPDSYRGEALVALVVPAREGLTEAALAAHLAERLVKYKWPSRILLRGDLPKTTVGKVDKVKIREELLA
jgi:long-chain acyl-CoA synthetase